MCSLEPKNEEEKYKKPTVRVGNWNEELFMQEYKLTCFLEKRDKGELFIQKTQKLFFNLLKEVTLSPPMPYIQFGMVIQIVAAKMPVCGSYPAAPLALSVVVNDQKINECQYINEDCDISIAPSYKACIRNSFKICSADAQNRERQFLKYGQDFYLECLETDGLPLILYSSPKNVGTLDGGSNYTFKTHGEVHQTLGLTKRFHNCFEFAEMKVPESPSYCRWKCLHIQPNIRPETEGDSVPANCPLVVAHSATNRNLAAEPCIINTVFGQESGVSVYNYQNVHRIEDFNNVWKIATRDHVDIQ